MFVFVFAFAKIAQMFGLVSNTGYLGLKKIFKKILMQEKKEKKEKKKEEGRKEKEKVEKIIYFKNKNQFYVELELKHLQKQFFP